MQVKVFEIIYGEVSGEVYHTYLAVKQDTQYSTGDEEDALKHTGKVDFIGIARIDTGIRPTHQYYDWDNSSVSDTYIKKMYSYIRDNFNRLASGMTLDYRFHITGEYKAPRPSQRVKQERANAAKKPLFK